MINSVITRYYFIWLFISLQFYIFLYVTGYALNDWDMSPRKCRDLSLFHHVQTGFEAYRACYPSGKGVRFLRLKRPEL
jgi:hypothetical protein